jgi:hypothetical protein
MRGRSTAWSPPTTCGRTGGVAVPAERRAELKRPSAMGSTAGSTSRWWSATAARRLRHCLRSCRRCARAANREPRWIGCCTVGIRAANRPGKVDSTQLRLGTRHRSIAAWRERGRPLSKRGSDGWRSWRGAIEVPFSVFYPTPSIVGFHSTGGLNCAGVALRIRGFKTIQARGNAKQSAGSSPVQIC